MKKLDVEFKEISDGIKRGKVVDKNPININIKSSDAQLKQYISTLKGIDYENIKIENSTKMAFGKA